MKRKRNEKINVKGNIETRYQPLKPIIYLTMY